jgi:3-phosphoshikimate 1-carboxyvinyltransferase
MVINGGAVLNGAIVDSHNDHRVAMALAIAATAAEVEAVIKNSQCVDVSFPTFFHILASF